MPKRSAYVDYVRYVVKKHVVKKYIANKHVVKNMW
jgi:hypothetical protein